MKTSDVSCSLRTRLLKFAGGLLLGAFTFSLFGAAPIVIRQNVNAPRPSSQFRPDHLLVRARAGVAAQELQAVHAQHRATMVRVMRHSKWHLVRLPPGRDVREAAAAYSRDARIERAEPDYLMTLSVAPNDPLYTSGRQWSLNNPSGSDIDAALGWDLRTSAGSIIVAVVDSGIRATHEDLAGNLWINPGESPNGIDDDGNGVVDDVHGFNAVAQDGNPVDENGHGTHVAGILGAVGNNGLGIAGVAWQVRIMACKFLGAGNSGYVSDAIECIDYARTEGARVINASWGGPESAALADSIAAARQQGILFVAAAGNNGLPTDLPGFTFYPAGYALDNVVSVGASTDIDAVAYFSNRGLGTVHLFAPGTDIWSCWYSQNNAYTNLSGTSMAAPIVSGALALLAAQFPTDSHQQLINRLLASVDQVSFLRESSSTGGRLNLHKALASTHTRPGNDAFTNAYHCAAEIFEFQGSPRTSPLLLAGSTVDATTESGEPVHAGQPPSPSAWWRWTAPRAGNMELRCTNTTFNTLMAVYTGSTVGSLTLLTENNDSPDDGSTNSLVGFRAEANTTYHIRVSGHQGASGTFRISGQYLAAPLNDAFANAIPITGSVATLSASNTVATVEAGEPTHAGVARNRSLWWSWTPVRSGTITVTTDGSTFDTVLAVYTGSNLSSLTPIASNDDNPAGNTKASAVTFAATAGVTYRIAVDAVGSATGLAVINTPPLNDYFQNRIAVSGASFHTNGFTYLATSEAGEPSHGGVAPGASVWWSWTAPVAGPMALSTAGSDFDTVLAVYTGANVGSLTLVAQNNNDGSAITSALVFEAQQGQTYQIAVGGVSGSRGRVQLTGGNAYTVVPIGGLDDAFPQSLTHGVNNRGQVVGYAYDRFANDQCAYVWSRETGMVRLAGNHSDAYGINDSGQICGTVGFPLVPVVWENGNQRYLGFGVFGEGKAINQSGDVAGLFSFWDTFHAALWRASDPSATIDLGVLEGDQASQAFGINDHGVVVGGSQMPDFRYRPFIWSNSVLRALPLPAGYTDGLAQFISNEGDIIGMVANSTVGVLWRQGQPIVLSSGPAQGSTVWAHSMHQNIIVGQVGSQPILWRNQTPELQPWDAALGWEFFGFSDINRHGFISGSGVYQEFASGFLLVPIGAISSTGPLLDITRAGANLVIGWSFTNAPGVLESTPAFGPPNWMPVPEPVFVLSNRASVSVPAAQPRQFFRLRTDP